MATRHLTDSGATSSVDSRVWRDRLRAYWPLVRFAGLYVAVGVLVTLALVAGQGAVAAFLEAHVTPLSRKALDALLRLAANLGLPRPAVDTKLELPLRELAVFVVGVAAVRVPVGEQVRGLVFGVLVAFAAYLGGALILPVATPWVPEPYAWASARVWDAVVLAVMVLAWLRWYVQLDPVAQG
jgi:hypothetical protein